MGEREKEARVSMTDRSHRSINPMEQHNITTALLYTTISCRRHKHRLTPIVVVYSMKMNTRRGCVDRKERRMSVCVNEWGMCIRKETRGGPILQSTIHTRKNKRSTLITLQVTHSYLTPPYHISYTYLTDYYAIDPGLRVGLTVGKVVEME